MPMPEDIIFENVKYKPIRVDTISVHNTEIEDATLTEAVAQLSPGTYYAYGMDEIGIISGVIVVKDGKDCIFYGPAW